MRRILVAGGAGFIGSNFAHYAHERYPECEVVALDKLTYAGSLENLEALCASPRFRFVQGDVCDPAAVREAMIGCDVVVNFAAEARAHRSLVEPGRFVLTDVHGTYVLLEAAVQIGVTRFVVVSTEEVYGTCAAGAFRETAPLRPCDPHAASKAGAELLARAYYATHGVCTLVTRGAATFGPYQHPEQLVAGAITDALEDRPPALEGDGTRGDWLYVRDHCGAIDTVVQRGVPGESYNIGSGAALSTWELMRHLLDVLGRPAPPPEPRIEPPRPEARCVIDSSRLRALGWSPRYSLEEALGETIRWYDSHRSWWRKLKAEAIRGCHRSFYVGGAMYLV